MKTTFSRVNVFLIAIFILFGENLLAQKFQLGIGVGPAALYLHGDASTD